MANWMIALVFGSVVTSWAYAKLLRAPGRAALLRDGLRSVLTGSVCFVVLFALLQMTVGYK